MALLPVNGVDEQGKSSRVKIGPHDGPLAPWSRANVVGVRGQQAADTSARQDMSSPWTTC